MGTADQPLHHRSGRCTPELYNPLPSKAAHCVGQARPDASLEVLVPFSARSPRCARPAMPSPDDPASARWRTSSSPSPCALSTLCTHTPATSAGPCGFTLWTELARSCDARFEIARVGRDAPPLLTRRCIGRVTRRRSCAGAFLQPAFRYPLPRARGLVGPLSASKLSLVSVP